MLGSRCLLAVPARHPVVGVPPPLHGSAAGQPQGIPPIWDTPGAIAYGASLTHAYGHKAWRIYLFIYLFPVA